MRGHSFSSALRGAGVEGGDERQSPHWSLAPFGYQRQRTSPRQRASPPAADARTPQQQAAAKAAARAELGKYHVEEIQPAGSPSPTVPLRYRSPRTSPRGGVCPSLRRGAARWLAGRPGSGLASVLLAALVLGVLLWGGHQLAAQRREELQQWMAYVPAVHPSVAFGAARQAAPTERSQRCQLQLDGSPWERHCQRLRRVCVDQGSLILYEDRYQQMDGRRAGALPELLVDTSKLYEYPWRKTSRQQQPMVQQGGRSDVQAEGGSSEPGTGGQGGGSGGAAGGQGRSLLYEVQEVTRNRRLQPVPMRPATSQEPTAYLREPLFSSCTVPLLLYPSWRGNFFHVFKDLSAVYYAMLRRTPWRHHVKLVVVTPDGLPLTQPESQLLPTLSGLSAQSLADFSRRLLPGHQIGQELDGAGLPSSYEGDEQRCFQDLFVCGRNFPLARGLLAAEEAALTPQQRDERLAREVPIEPFAFGQAVAAYRTQAALGAGRSSGQASPGAAGPGVQDGISLQEAAAGAAGTAAGAAGATAERAKTRGRMRVLLIKRGGEGRQLLNAAELLRACNAWSWLPPGAGDPVTADCQEVMFPDLASGIAAAREADVFIGMHGANLANGWLMRPGSSVIELTPYGFDTGRGSFVFSTTNSNDATSRVLWWVGVVCDPAVSSPGPTELAQRPPEDWWPRDRNSRVPWAMLEAALREAVLTGGDQQRYLRDYYKPGLHKWHLLPGGQLQWGGRCPNATRAA